MKQILVIFSLLLLFIGCEKKKEQSIETSKSVQKVYEYMPVSTAISFTAYKYTRRAGVNGKFDTFTINGTKAGLSPQDVFANASFEILISSVNTSSPARDKKINAFFFDVLASSDKMVGKVKSLNADGTGIVTITLNEKESEIPVTLTQNGKNVILSGAVDLEKHHAQKAIDSLNKACGKNHIGKDGIAKMWPDVDFKITTVLK